MSRNMVTTQMKKIFTQSQPYNSTSSRTSVGIWRYAEGGPVMVGEYDYRTEAIGPYKVHEQYGYVTEFYRNPTPRLAELYIKLLETKTGVAAFFVNNRYVCVVYPDALKYWDLEEGGYETYNVEVEGVISVVNIGYIKTYLRTFQKTQIPYALQWNLEKGIFLPTIGWQPMNDLPQIMLERDSGLYKKLLANPNASAIYRSIQLNSEVYI